jgi:uncharacterized Zn finger protein
MMHVDTWRCDRCQRSEVVKIEEYDYEVSCDGCGKAMKLYARNPE